MAIGVELRSVGACIFNVMITYITNVSPFIICFTLLHDFFFITTAILLNHFIFNFKLWQYFQIFHITEGKGGINDDGRALHLGC